MVVSDSEGTPNVIADSSALLAESLPSARVGDSLFIY